MNAILVEEIIERDVHRAHRGWRERASGEFRDRDGGGASLIKASTIVCYGGISERAAVRRLECGVSRLHPMTLTNRGSMPRSIDTSPRNCARRGSEIISRLVGLALNSPCNNQSEVALSRFEKAAPRQTLPQWLEQRKLVIVQLREGDTFGVAIELFVFQFLRCHFLDFTP
jgi:hypothetical protein